MLLKGLVVARRQSLRAVARCHPLVTKVASVCLDKSNKMGEVSRCPTQGAFRRGAKPWRFT
jgi:hypothetical protein